MAGSLTDLFDLGFAVPAGALPNGVVHWLYQGEDYTLPVDSVPMRVVEGVPFKVARIEDLREALRKQLGGEQ